MTIEIDNIAHGRQLLQKQFPTKLSQKAAQGIFRDELKSLLLFVTEVKSDMIGYDFDQHKITNINPVPLTDVNVVQYIRDQLLCRIAAVAKRVFPGSQEKGAVLLDYLAFKMTGIVVTDYEDFILNGPDPRTLVPRFLSPLEELQSDAPRKKKTSSTKASLSN